MSRTSLLSSAIVVACGLILGSLTGSAPAQNPQPAEKPDRETLQNPQLVVEPLPARLEQILKDWENATGQIKTLEGTHTRFVYDNTFKSEKRSKGVFYYEAPDKGRFDIETIPIVPGKTSDKRDAKGQAYQLTSDTPETWISDGTKIIQMDPVKREATVITIPPERRGKNIVDGPLPFLFGLPAEQAKKRFKFQLLGEHLGPKKNQIALKVEPRWESDAANWSQARILLDEKTYLPSAVELTDPSGTNQVTSYKFETFEINKKPVFPLFKNNPFKPNLIGWTMLVDQQLQQPVQGPPQGPKATVEPGGRAVVVKGVPVPSVIRMSWVDAKAALQKKGFDVSIQRGSKPNKPDLLRHVERQLPMPNELANPGQKVYIYVYDDSTAQTSAAPQQPANTRKTAQAQDRTAAKPGVNQ